MNDLNKKIPKMQVICKFLCLSYYKYTDIFMERTIMGLNRIGIDVGGTNVKIALVDETGSIFY